MMRCVIITGVSGQDGSLMADLLLEKNYKVVGIKRRSSTRGDWRIKHLYSNPNFTIESGDITDISSISRLVRKYKPDEFFNFAAQSFVGASWNEPLHTLEATGKGVLVCLEALRQEKIDCKFYQASSSEMYGKVLKTPQNEDTRFNPLSPYAAAKAFGHYISNVYRQSYGMFICCGILFNHEGSRRGIEFVTRKITDAAAKIKLGIPTGYTDRPDELPLGNIKSQRDWGDARDYVKAAWLMLQHDIPDDYVIATGKLNSIEDLLDEAFLPLGLDWHNHVTKDIKYWRPADVTLLLGDSSKARKVLGWKPEYDFKALIRDMVKEDLRRNRV